MESDVIISESISYSGIGDFKESYSYAHDWLRDEQFDIAEDSYNEKVKGDSKDIGIKWICIRNLTDYFRIKLEIKWRVLGVTDVEVEMNGKKKKMNKISAMKIDVKGTIERDYNSKWEGSAMSKFFKDVYHKFIIRESTDEKKGQVTNLVQEFADEMKAFFDLMCRRN